MAKWEWYKTAPKGLELGRWAAMSLLHPEAAVIASWWWCARVVARRVDGSGICCRRTSAPKVRVLHETACLTGWPDGTSLTAPFWALGIWQYLRQVMVHELLPNSIGTDGAGLNM